MFMLCCRILRAFKAKESSDNSLFLSSSSLFYQSFFKKNFSTTTTQESKNIGLLTYYPASSSSSSVQNKKENQNKSSVNKVALLSGWTDGTERHLRNYVKIYHSLGIDVYTVTSQSKDFVFPSRVTNSFTKHNSQVSDHFLTTSKVLTNNSPFENCIDVESTQKELIVHCFSNGGLLTLYYMSTSFPRFHDLKISHIILDSCPGGHLLRPISYVRALTTTITNPVIKVLASVIVYLFATLDILAMKIAKGKYKSFVIKIRELLLETPSILGAKTLFLYSNSDKIVLPQDIEIFANTRKRHISQLQTTSNTAKQVEMNTSAHKANDGNIVSSGNQSMYNFNDSQHVLHYKQYPEKYTSLIHEFVSS